MAGRPAEGHAGRGRANAVGSCREFGDARLIVVVVMLRRMKCSVGSWYSTRLTGAALAMADCVAASPSAAPAGVVPGNSCRV